MPSFREHVEMLESWRAFPGVERLGGEAADDAPRAALTFDDGPDPDGTPAVLDALDAAGVKATFFVVGEQLMRHWAIAREARERGHQLALHGAAHPRHAELSPPAARDEVARGVGAFEAATGERAELFRPPYGRFSEHSHAACLKLGLTPVYWSAWGSDWDPIPAERIAELAVRDLTPGAIVLLHDSARYAVRPSAAPTAEAVPAIAAAARERGLEIGPIGPAPSGG
jgi:peptidoglycan/xylan/chitin deacetylase (PgdA/CDA1 family)